MLQESELWAQKQDVLVMQIAAFSGGSFRYLVGESEASVKPIESDVTKKSGTQSNSSIFGELWAREKEDLRRAGLVAAIEVRLLLFNEPIDNRCFLLERTFSFEILFLSLSLEPLEVSSEF